MGEPTVLSHQSTQHSSRLRVPKPAPSHHIGFDIEIRLDTRTTSVRYRSCSPSCSVSPPHLPFLSSAHCRGCKSMSNQMFQFMSSFHPASLTRDIFSLPASLASLSLQITGNHSCFLFCRDLFFSSVFCFLVTVTVLTGTGNGVERGEDMW